MGFGTPIRNIPPVRKFAAVPSPWPTPPNLPYQGDLLHAVNTHVESAPPPADTPDSPGRVTRLLSSGALSPSQTRPMKLELTIQYSMK
jgi:hypothetical protein